MSNNGRACVSEKYPLIAGRRLDLEREGGARTSAVLFFLEYDLNAAKCNSICHFLGVGTKPFLFVFCHKVEIFQQERTFLGLPSLGFQ